MSAQEGTTAHWYQVRVVTESETHYSNIEQYAQDELEELHEVLDAVVKMSAKDGGCFSFFTEVDGGRTFIPVHRIRYITVLKVDPPE